MSFVNDQADNILPPRQGQILPINVNTTSLSYDLRNVALQSNYIPDQKRQFVFVTLNNRGSADVYFYFSNTNSTNLNDANAVALGANLAFATSYGAKLASGSERSYRIDKDVDRYLCVKTNSSTAVVELYVSSEPSISGA
jgi:hypothetical protein